MPRPSDSNDAMLPSPSRREPQANTANQPNGGKMSKDLPSDELLRLRGMSYPNRNQPAHFQQMGHDQQRQGGGIRMDMGQQSGLIQQVQQGIRATKDSLSFGGRPSESGGFDPTGPSMYQGNPQGQQYPMSGGMHGGMSGGMSGMDQISLEQAQREDDLLLRLLIARRQRVQAKINNRRASYSEPKPNHHGLADGLLSLSRSQSSGPHRGYDQQMGPGPMGGMNHQGMHQGMHPNMPGGLQSSMSTGNLPRGMQRPSMLPNDPMNSYHDGRNSYFAEERMRMANSGGGIHMNGGGMGDYMRGGEPKNIAAPMMEGPDRIDRHMSLPHRMMDARMDMGMHQQPINNKRPQDDIKPVESDPAPAAKRKRVHKKKPSDMPRRPLSAYNLFFSEERERILQEIDAEEKGEDAASKSADDKKDGEKDSEEKDGAKKSDDDKKSDDEAGSDGAKAVKEDGATDGDKKEDKKDGEGEDKKEESKDGDQKEEDAKPLALRRPLIPSEKKRRPHRKTHGKIGFQLLAQMVGKRWKALDDERRKYYQDLAQEDMKRHKKAMEEYYQKQADSKEGEGPAESGSKSPVPEKKEETAAE